MSSILLFYDKKFYHIFIKGLKINDMEVSKAIRATREKKGLTQADMATRMNTERSNYARLESRDTNLTLKQLQGIADALEVTIYDIIGMPEGVSLSDSQAEKVKRLEERLELTEEALKDKKRNIKFYKSFIEWVRDKFKSQFTILALSAAESLDMKELVLESDEDVDIYKHGFTEDDFKKIGDYMFSYESANYFLNDFIAASGFINDKWFIDAYKRHNRRNKAKTNFAEVKNWVNGVFEFLDEE
jgi:transcriptional regulator with XRE-family HTH domain